MVTTVIGGLGSDTINVMGDVTRADRQQRAGPLGRHHARPHSGDPGYDDVGVNGVGVNVFSRQRAKASSRSHPPAGR